MFLFFPGEFGLISLAVELYCHRADERKVIPVDCIRQVKYA